MAGTLSSCALVDRIRNQEETSWETEETGSAEPEGTDEASSETEAESETEIVPLLPPVLNIYRCVYEVSPESEEKTFEIEQALNAWLLEEGYAFTLSFHDIPMKTYADELNLALLNEEADVFYTNSKLQNTDLWTLYTKDLVLTKDGVPHFSPQPERKPYGYTLTVNRALETNAGMDLSCITELSQAEPLLNTARDMGISYPLVMYGGGFTAFASSKYDSLTGDQTLISVDLENNTVTDPIRTDVYRNYCHLMAVYKEQGLLSELEASQNVPVSVRYSDDFAVLSGNGTDPAEIVPADNSGKYHEIVLSSPFENAVSSYSCGYSLPAYLSADKQEAAETWLQILSADHSVQQLYYQSTDQEAEAAEAKTTSAAGFMPDFRSEQKTWNEVQKVVQEYGNALETGCFPDYAVDDMIAAYQAALDQAGYQTLFQMAEEQYAVWSAGKEP